MPIFAKAASILSVSALVATCGLGADGASAQTVPSAQPCSGTLCDFYYGGKGPAAPQTSTPSASQQGVPVTVPTGNIFSGLFNSSGGTQGASSGAAAPGAAQDASTPFVRVVGGRPANERCTGTFCDVYYSGSPAATAPEQPPVGRQASAAAPAAATSSDVAPAPVRKHVALPQSKPICHNERDPWQCYR